MSASQSRLDSVPTANVGWIKLGTVLMIIGYILVASYNIATGHRDVKARGPEVLAAVMGVVALFVVKKHAKLAGAITIAAVWFEMNVTLFQWGTFNSTSVIVYPTLVAASALLLGPRGAIASGVCSIISIPLAVFLGGLPWSGILADRGHEGLWWLVTTFTIVAASALAYAALLSYSKLLSRSEEQRARYLALFELAPDGLLSLDTAGIVQEANAAAIQLLGQAKESVVGGPLSAVLAKAGIDTPFDFKQAIEGQKLLEVSLVDEASYRRSIEISIRKAGVAEDTTLLVLRDITQRKLIEQRIGHAQRLEAVGQLAGGIAHDFNNLLTAIGGSAELIATLDDPEAKSFAEVILSAQRRGSNLTRQLLAFARRDMHQPSRIELQSVVSGMSKLLERMLGEQHPLRVNPNQPASINADSSQVEQILINLVTNARDAMPKGGTVTITIDCLPYSRAQQLGSKVEAEWQAMLEVADTGMGVPPEIQARIFEPFFTTKEKGKGTGLGLAAVQGIVSQNRGCVALESEVSRGSKFRVFFPAVRSNPRPGAFTRSPFATEGNRPRRILLVDDEDLVRDSTAKMLRHEGYEVAVASDGPSALDALSNLKAMDVVLTDLAMPGMNGRELAQKIHSSNPSLPIVYMSGYFAEPGQSPSAIAATDKMAVFLPKPFSREDLVGALRKALEGSGQASD